MCYGVTIPVLSVFPHLVIGDDDNDILRFPHSSRRNQSSIPTPKPPSKCFYKIQTLHTPISLVISSRASVLLPRSYITTLKLKTLYSESPPIFFFFSSFPSIEISLISNVLIVFLFFFLCRTGRRVPYSMAPEWRALWYSNLDELQRVNDANDNNTISNVTVQLGGNAFLHCKVRNLAERTVSGAEVSVNLLSILFLCESENIFH